jgi:hypothetical protein
MYHYIFLKIPQIAFNDHDTMQMPQDFLLLI